MSKDTLALRKGRKEELSFSATENIMRRINTILAEEKERLF